MDSELAASLYRPGDLIGDKYRLTQLIGEGGMGAVWAAMQLDMSLEVAIKIVQERLPDSVEEHRLRREAQAIAQVRHSGCVRALDFGQTERGDWYLVLERLDGVTLSDALEDGPLDPDLAVRLFLPLASSLEALHRKGIVHRDVKPDNIILTRGDSNRTCPKLIDFGIAQISPESAGHYGPAPAEHGPVGTPGYLAPEQILLGPVDERADVWGFCVTLVEAVAGKPLFGGDGLTPIIAAASMEVVTSVRDHCPDIPDGLSDILQKGLSPAPAGRWPGMHALREALAEYLYGRGIERDIAGLAITEYLRSEHVEAKRPGRTPAARASEPPDDRSLPPPLRRSRRSSATVLAAAVAVGAAILLDVNPATLLIAAVGAGEPASPDGRGAAATPAQSGAAHHPDHAAELVHRRVEVAPDSMAPAARRFVPHE